MLQKIVPLHVSPFWSIFFKVVLASGNEYGEFLVDLDQLRTERENAKMYSQIGQSEIH